MNKFDLPEPLVPEPLLPDPVAETTAGKWDWLGIALASGASVLVVVRQAGALRDGTLKRSLRALPNQMVRIGNPLASKLTVERMLIQIDGEPEDDDFDLEPADALLANLTRREGGEGPLLVVVDDAQTLAPDALDALAKVPRATGNGTSGRVLILVGTQEVLGMIANSGLTSLQKPFTVILPQMLPAAPRVEVLPSVDEVKEDVVEAPAEVSRPFSRSLAGDAPIPPGLASLRVPPSLSADTRLSPLKRTRRRGSLWPFVLGALLIGGGYVAWSYYPRDTGTLDIQEPASKIPPAEAQTPPVEISPAPAPEVVAPAPTPPPVTPAVPAPASVPIPVPTPKVTPKAPVAVVPAVVPPTAAPRLPSPAVVRPPRPSIPVLPDLQGDKQPLASDREAVPQELSPLPSMLGQLPELPELPPQPAPARPPADGLRQGFDAFLNRAGTDTEHLTPADRAALFQEYLAWRARNALPPMPVSRVP